MLLFFLSCIDHEKVNLFAKHPNIFLGKSNSVLCDYLIIDVK